MKLGNGVGSVYKLSGNRRNPYIVRKTFGWDINTETGRAKQLYVTIGYAPTRAKGLEMLMEYNKNPYDIDASKITFAEVYEKWSEEKFPTISNSNIKGYQASFNSCAVLHSRIFKELKLIDLQGTVDSCGKNYPTLRKLKVLLNQMYEYAMKYELCSKDYSQYVEIQGQKPEQNRPFAFRQGGDRSTLVTAGESLCANSADVDLQRCAGVRAA